MTSPSTQRHRDAVIQGCVLSPERINHITLTNTPPLTGLFARSAESLRTSLHNAAYRPQPKRTVAGGSGVRSPPPWSASAGSCSRATCRSRAKDSSTASWTMCSASAARILSLGWNSNQTNSSIMARPWRQSPGGPTNTARDPSARRSGPTTSSAATGSRSASSACSASRRPAAP